MKLIGVKEVSDLLGVNETAIYRMTSRRQIPFYRIGRYCKFDPEELSEWLQGKKQNVKQTGGGINRS